MEIVINIPKKIYSYINTQWRDIPKNDSPISIMCNAVIDGTPLPKGHGRIGDLDELEQRMSNFIENTTIVADEYTVAKLIVEGIRETPTIIEADKEASDG